MCFVYKISDITIRIAMNKNENSDDETEVSLFFFCFILTLGCFKIMISKRIGFRATPTVITCSENGKEI